MSNRQTLLTVSQVWSITNMPSLFGIFIQLGLFPTKTLEVSVAQTVVVGIVVVAGGAEAVVY
jgi:hypothetical protein